MKNKFAFTSAFLLITLMLAGCYTQLSYLDLPPSERQAYRQDRERATKRKQVEREQPELESEEAEVESSDEADKEDSDEGYYGRRKSTYRRHTRYYNPHEFYGYPSPDPYYYGGYYSVYPYYHPYGYYGHHRHYGHYGHYYSRGYRNYSSKVYSHRTYKNGNLHYGKQRTRSYRGRSR